MISTTVIVACRGTKRWFDLDAVRTEHQHGNVERLVGTLPDRSADRAEHGKPWASPAHPAGAPPLDWHLDGLTTSTDFQPREGTMSLRYIVGDTRDVTATIPDGSVDLIFTSPPFLALRSYLPADHPDKHREIGSEPNPAAFIDTLLALTAEWGRVLAPHGTLAVELGDTHSGAGGENHLWDTYVRHPGNDPAKTKKPKAQDKVRGSVGWPLAKSLAGIPQLYMIALAYGINPLTGQPSPAGRWRVRNVIAWHRPNPPVGALGDKWRPASSTITVACRGAKRWFDLDAVRGDVSDWTKGYAERYPVSERAAGEGAKGFGRSQGGAVLADTKGEGLNQQGGPPLDWHQDGDLGVGHIVLSTQPYTGSHYATFPMELPRKIIDCMCPRQVCRVCGLARERVTQKTAEYQAYRDDTPDERSDAMAARQAVTGGGPTHNGTLMTAQYETLGWTDCGHDDYRPGLTFDPFVGSGTTLAAAQDLGRDAIGVDIDESNAWLARERCGMFLEVEHHVPPVVDVATQLL